jgi:hypothetical protein
MATPPKSSPPREFAIMPLTLHLETLGALATPLVLRGTPLPTSRSQTFSTADDNQTTVELHVLLGESPLANKNYSLGRYKLTGIPKAPRGTPAINVTYSVDKLCRVTVSATVAGSELAITSEVTDPQPFLTEAKIGQALRRADEEKEDDQHQVSEVEARTQAKTALAQAESTLASLGTKNARKASQISAAVADLGLALDSGIVERIRGSTQELNSAIKGQGNTLGDIPGMNDVFASFFASPPKSSRTSTASKTSRAASAPSRAPTQPKPTRQLGRIFGGGEYVLDSSLCFVLMPFADEFQAVYDDHIKKVLTDLGLVAQRADEIASTSMITWDIWERINKARFIIADMTGRNPNVFYEVGLAHALSKEVILLTRSMGDIPFDLQALRFIVYDYTPRGMSEFEKKLRSAAQALMQAS